MDKPKGVVRIPLDRAMDLFSQEAANGKVFYPAKATVPKKEEPTPAAPAAGGDAAAAGQAPGQAGAAAPANAAPAANTPPTANAGPVTGTAPSTAPAPKK
jgi:hypothetical protein